MTFALFVALLVGVPWAPPPEGVFMRDTWRLDDEALVILTDAGDLLVTTCDSLAVAEGWTLSGTNGDLATYWRVSLGIDSPVTPYDPHGRCQVFAITGGTFDAKGPIE